jgi:L-rhamnose isomerase
MPKYEVSGTLEVSFKVVVEADDEDKAEEKVNEMDYDSLTDGSDRVTIDVDAIDELKEKSR